MTDITIIGGGIVGIATALAVQRAWPGLAVQLLEKEDTLARHQTGRNSGVIHAGIYYAPGSLKAEFCRRGVAATVRFCTEHQLPFEQCGKLLVATSQDEAERLAALTERARTNGIDVRPISATELREREPNIAGLAGLLSPTTGIADYAAITNKMAELFTALGGEIVYDARVTGIDESPSDVTLSLADGQRQRTRRVIACAGLDADRLAAMCGLADDFAIVPFKGEYYRLAPRHDSVVNHLIYPVPDPDLPFLGIHLTRMIGGYVTVGPNAVLSLAREGYGGWAMSARDMGAMARFPGFWRTIGANLSSGVGEMASSVFRRRYLRKCQRYCPSLELSDLQPHPPGIRAQAVMRDGTLVHDFLIRNTARTIHICNAPSPAATSAMPIADHIRDEAARVFGLNTKGT
ncbi:MAG: L-2-hydroxyglutarate oxidase [Hyphomicrobiales bacterium]|nr:L-2-hydroxyglutarate oxidase [Hyphomicrobiales bacterium]